MRDLWAAVVNQALDDLREFPYDSVEFSQAEAFFVGRGEWACSREQIADFLELHPDDISRVGQSVIQARHREDGGPVKKIAPKPAPPPPVLVVSHDIAPAPASPNIKHKHDPSRVQRGLKQPWWLQRKLG